MAKNIFSLGKYFSNDYYIEVCKKMTLSIVAKIDYPSAYSNWLQVFLNLDENIKEVVLTGSEVEEYVKQLNATYCPNILLAFAKNESEVPLLAGKFQLNKNLFYICKNKTCSAPHSDFSTLLSNLA